jgi:hypothetical protein
MQGIYCEEDETCNVTCAPPSSWSWYEDCHNISSGTTKMNGAIGDIGCSHASMSSGKLR